MTDTDLRPDRPQLTFFCELGKDALDALFGDPRVIEQLKAMQARVSLGILDLSDQRAAVVQRLNRAGVAVVAWLLLPEEEGYWFNLENVSQAAARYRGFAAWTARYGLRWSGVGLDIEPHIHEVRQLFCHKWRLPWICLRRLFAVGKLNQARSAYQDLMARMRGDGYPVYNYQIAYLVDERMAGTTFLQRINGLVDIPADYEVLMLYSNFFRPHGPGLLWSYGSDAQSVAVGITGGGVTIEGMRDVPPLNWQELARDLRLAKQVSGHIHVFSLEGCVRQNFLEQLQTFDWNEPVEPPLRAARNTDRLRKLLRVCLRIRAYPLILLLGLFILLRLVPRLVEKPEPVPEGKP